MRGPGHADHLDAAVAGGLQHRRSDSPDAPLTGNVCPGRTPASRITGSAEDRDPPKIADTALRLFLQRGYDAVGIRDVAAEADVAVTMSSPRKRPWCDTARPTAPPRSGA
uniref:helix-turn-helix domain-containing protein n=1 Tax=Nonomuraea pusilla TaxID=46177 RepID=UPI001F226E7E|nr:helix-turn-helix domain-containing protein [Nonomuraea pusilla]